MPEAASWTDAAVQSAIIASLMTAMVVGAEVRIVYAFLQEGSPCVLSGFKARVARLRRRGGTVYSARLEDVVPDPDAVSPPERDAVDFPNSYAQAAGCRLVYHGSSAVSQPRPSPVRGVWGTNDSESSEYDTSSDDVAPTADLPRARSRPPQEARPLGPALEIRTDASMLAQAFAETMKCVLPVGTKRPRDDDPHGRNNMRVLVEEPRVMVPDADSIIPRDKWMFPHLYVEAFTADQDTVRRQSEEWRDHLDKWLSHNHIRSSEGRTAQALLIDQLAVAATMHFRSAFLLATAPQTTPPIPLRPVLAHHVILAGLHLVEMILVQVMIWKRGPPSTQSLQAKLDRAKERGEYDFRSVWASAFESDNRQRDGGRGKHRRDKKGHRGSREKEKDDAGRQRRPSKERRRD